MIGVSKSSLELFKDCPRCFWMDKVAKIKRPDHIVAGITKGIDRVMKEHTESLLIRGDTDNRYLRDWPQQAPFPDRLRLRKLRKWQTFQAQFEVGGMAVKVWGELDDLLIDSKGQVSPWDYKSKGSKPNALEDAVTWNQTQMDIYALLLSENGFKCSGVGFLTYTWPELIDLGLTGEITFGHETVSISTHPEDAMRLATSATLCLNAETAPAASVACQYCDFIAVRTAIQMPAAV